MKFYTYKLSEQAKQELAIGDFENESILYPLSQFDMHFTDMNELIARITPAELEMLKTALHKEELREQLLNKKKNGLRNLKYYENNFCK